MAALRAATRRMPVAPSTLTRTTVVLPSRHASSSAVSDPKSKASSLIDSLPGNSVVSKTGWVVLGTALTGAAISNEIFVINDEAVILGAFVTFCAFLGSQIRKPYTEWADSQIEKTKSVLNASRVDHVDAVKGRIGAVEEMKDVVDITKQLYNLSRETAQMEHEAHSLRQKVAVRDEIKSVLDAWVRAEGKQREAEQAELSRTVIANVEKQLGDAKLQKDILADAVQSIENLVKDKKI